MHCILEGLTQQHFRFVLGLTSSSAANEPLPQKAFSHDFTKIEHNGEFPDNMTLKEVKQVDAISWASDHVPWKVWATMVMWLTKNHLPNLCFHLRGNYQAKI
jgi:hypothetical protein